MLPLTQPPWSFEPPTPPVPSQLFPAPPCLQCSLRRAIPPLQRHPHLRPPSSPGPRAAALPLSLRLIFPSTRHPAPLSLSEPHRRFRIRRQRRRSLRRGKQRGGSQRRPRLTLLHLPPDPSFSPALLVALPGSHQASPPPSSAAGRLRYSVGREEERRRSVAGYSNLIGKGLNLMAPPILAFDNRGSPDRYNNKPCSGLQLSKSFASVTMEEGKPFDFLRIFCEGVIAGGTAGVVVESALYPIDTIKTRLQAARGGGKIVWRGLYSGLAGNLAGVLPASALFVGVYEPMKQKLLKIFPENLSAFAHLSAGAIGGATASLIRVPTEVVKQRMQTRQFASAPDAVRLIVSKEGFKGLYAGYGSFLLRDLPFDAIQFCIYEQLRIGYKLAARRDLTDPENAVIGAFAGAITGAVTTPLDVIKTRLMVQGSANQYRGIVDCVQTVVREEGPSALLKGIGPRVLWIGIGGSIFFGVLERTKLLLAQQHPGKAARGASKED